MDSTGGESTAVHPVLSVIASSRRRRLLSLLQERTSPVAELDLAAQVAAVEGEKPLVEVTREEAERIHADLVHVHLPRLVETSLVAWDLDHGTVAGTDHPVLEDPHYRHLVETEADGWDRVVASLAHSRRRIVLAVLAENDGSMERDALAARVFAREPDATDTALTDVRTSLHHVHLPKLDAADLVEYDPDGGTATYRGHPALDEEWLEFAPAETAITGAGEDNGLVVLMRELLGSRLDQLDAQSEDFRSHIPL